MKSTHRVDVVKINKINKHPNADTLGIVQFWDFTVVVRLQDWNEGDLAVYIQPDSVCPNTPPFEFLGSSKRIKVKKLRGVYSQGLLMPLHEIFGPDYNGSLVKEGDDVAELVGITRYDPPIQNMSTRTTYVESPEGHYPVYDVENFYRYSHTIDIGTQVVATEKIHGTNGRFVYQDGKFHCGTRTRWASCEDKNPWWAALENCDWLKEWLVNNEGLCVYGEVYGPINDLKYGQKTPDVRVFDIFTGSRWLDYTEMKRIGEGLRFCPVVYYGPYDPEKLKELAEGESLIETADHIREGIVIRPIIEKFHMELGRVVLKIVSNGYMER